LTESIEALQRDVEEIKKKSAGGSKAKRKA
jgi:hypothetical protein